MSRLFKEYVLGDMTVRYVTDEMRQKIGLVLLPADMPYPDKIEKNMKVDSMVQVKAAGDIYEEAYAQGNTMRNGETVRRMSFYGQEAEEGADGTVVTTTLIDDRGCLVHHILSWKKDTPYIRIRCKFENRGLVPVDLEMFESFSIGEISPYLDGDGWGQLDIYRLRSVWSQEGRLEVIPAEDLQLGPSCGAV